MQVPAQVEYEKAASVEHALALLARYGPEARVLAGGHSLIPMMKLRLAQPETLIDINGLTELAYIRVTGGELLIGAPDPDSQRVGKPLAPGTRWAFCLCWRGRRYRFFHRLDSATLIETRRGAERASPTPRQLTSVSYRPSITIKGYFL